MASSHDTLMRLILQYMEDKNELTLGEIKLSGGGDKRMIQTVVAMSKDGGPDPIARWHRFERATNRIYGSMDFIDIAKLRSTADNGLFYCTTKGCKELSLEGPCDRCVVGITDDSLKVTD